MITLFTLEDIEILKNPGHEKYESLKSEVLALSSKAIINFLKNNIRFKDNNEEDFQDFSAEFTTKLKETFNNRLQKFDISKPKKGLDLISNLIYKKFLANRFDVWLIRQKINYGIAMGKSENNNDFWQSQQSEYTEDDDSGIVDSLELFTELQLEINPNSNSFYMATNEHILACQYHYQRLISKSEVNNKIKEILHNNHPNYILLPNYHIKLKAKYLKLYNNISEKMNKKNKEIYILNQKLSEVDKKLSFQNNKNKKEKLVINKESFINKLTKKKNEKVKLNKKALKILDDFKWCPLSRKEVCNITNNLTIVNHYAIKSRYLNNKGKYAKIYKDSAKTKEIL